MYYILNKACLTESGFASNTNIDEVRGIFLYKSSVLVSFRDSATSLIESNGEVKKLYTEKPDPSLRNIRFWVCDSNFHCSWITSEELAYIVKSKDYFVYDCIGSVWSPLFAYLNINIDMYLLSDTSFLWLNRRRSALEFDITEDNNCAIIAAEDRSYVLALRTGKSAKRFLAKLNKMRILGIVE